tara:strand:+ start:2517 stop:2678 length:162 start_codon:yes stop_codon:yes gene_type:complete
MKILFKWQLGKEYKIFNSEKELIKELRTQVGQKLSDEFIVDESHALGEWKYIN